MSKEHNILDYFKDVKVEEYEPRSEEFSDSLILDIAIPKMTLSLFEKRCLDFSQHYFITLTFTSDFSKYKPEYLSAKVHQKLKQYLNKKHIDLYFIKWELSINGFFHGHGAVWGQYPHIMALLANWYRRHYGSMKVVEKIKNPIDCFNYIIKDKSLDHLPILFK